MKKYIYATVFAFLLNSTKEYKLFNEIGEGSAATATKPKPLSNSVLCSRTFLSTAIKYEYPFE